MLISELLENEGMDDCPTDCEFYKEWEECHPYGMGSACETLCECEATDTDECPRIEENET